MLDPEQLLVVLSQPRSAVAESYRGLRTSIQRALTGGVKTLMFVSAYGGDGKSSVCANIAVTLTQLYLDVVLVDCDLRRPTLTKLFNVDGRPGMGDFINGSAPADSVFLDTGIERLKIVPAGTAKENAGDLLGRPTVREFCQTVSERCDVAIFDTSPISACSDALSLGAHMDTSIMVISPKRWDGEVEVRVRQSLEAHHIPVLGVILNGADPTVRGKYGAGYGYIYGYGYGAKKRESAYGYGYYYNEGDHSQGPSEKREGWFSRLFSWLS